MDLQDPRKGRLRQLIRCHQLVDRVASCRIGYTATLLAEELGCTTKTIYRDLRALREAGVAIEYDNRRKRYVIGESHVARAYLGNGNGSARRNPAGVTPPSPVVSKWHKGHQGESCAEAIRGVMQSAEILTFSELCSRVERKGSWKEQTVWQHLMALVVNLPPARQRWATYAPFLFLHGDGRYELYDPQTHPEPREK